jgi:tRNA modification GTPase
VRSFRHALGLLLSGMRSAATIFGLSSAPGRAAVSVFRLSGPHCAAVWSALTRSKALPLERRATHVRLWHPRTGQQIDSCLALLFRAPASFSGEDMLVVVGCAL